MVGNCWTDIVFDSVRAPGGMLTATFPSLISETSVESAATGFSTAAASSSRTVTATTSGGIAA